MTGCFRFSGAGERCTSHNMTDSINKTPFDEVPHGWLEREQCQAPFLGITCHVWVDRLHCPQKNGETSCVRFLIRDH